MEQDQKLCACSLSPFFLHPLIRSHKEQNLVEHDGLQVQALHPKHLRNLRWGAQRLGQSLEEQVLEAD